jgi:hypothetical protein
MIYDLLTNSIASIIAAVASIGAAIFYQWFTLRIRKEKEKYKNDIEQIASAAQNISNINIGADPFAFLKIKDKVPSGISAKQLSTFANDIKSSFKEALEVNTKATAAIEKLINNYHEQALGQSKTQFWFSVGAATIGFIWILVYGASIQPENWVTASKILPGIVMDSVAFLFFRQASDTRQRATELYDRLRKDKQSTESISLVSSIEDIKVRSAVKAQIALHMSGLTPSPIDLKSFLSGESNVSIDKSKNP